VQSAAIHPDQRGQRLRAWTKPIANQNPNASVAGDK
jgi:hypothetical protein